MNKTLTLSDIAQLLGARLQGESNKVVTGLQTLSRAGDTELSFLANPRYRKALMATSAAAVLLREEELPHCPTDALILDNPYLGYARISHYFKTADPGEPGLHATAVVDPSAQIDPSAVIGPGVVIEARAQLGAGVCVGANSVVGADCQIGAESMLAANVSIYQGVRIGERCIIHSGAVIGADGFGFANAGGKWVKIAQLGSVVIGNDVEVGANTTIDRGALDDTLIHDGVKLDNQIQIAHNVEIGQDSALAGCAGIAGSSKIGRRCTLGGGAGIAGHIELVDDVHVTAMSLVTKSLKQPGAYSSGTVAEPNAQWKRNVVHFRQLDALARRVHALESSVAGRDQVQSQSPQDNETKG